MSAIIRKIVTVVEETYLEMDRRHAANPPRRGHRRDRESVRRKICRGSFAADRDWRGTRRIARGEGSGGAGHRRAERAKLRQGRSGRRKRRAGTCGSDLASQDGRAGTQGAGQGRGADSVVQEARRARNNPEYSARPQGCGVRAKSFDGMEVQINDAPRANEIMVALAVTDSGRPLPRVGGLTVAEIKGEDGLR